ncbi:disease resistance protein RUN1-like [Argentina anserina]|uniref:disease resistance protein RUN1-like n=1 Tax=Argentina anserina TaxID=57926 RepID=UPI0021766C68|nr:disease resistance protein RUN1-like [Potentilla anserina]
MDVLIEKSLLTIGTYNHIEMHDLIREMAWEIVRQESIEEPAWYIIDMNVELTYIDSELISGNSIKGIRLCLSELEEADSTWNYESLSNMLSLRHLEFDNLITSSGPKFLPNSLRVLRWSWFPSKSLPASYSPNLLTELKMENSKLVQLWDGRLDLPTLKYMDLRNSKNLIKTPDVTGIPNLEVLELQYCTHLVKIHPSLAIHKRLKHLELVGCKRIKNLPSEIEMDSLELLGLGGCSKVKTVPEFGSRMKSLYRLKLSGTAIGRIPSSVGHLVGLVDLELSDCNNLVSLPGSMVDNLKSLKYPHMNDCSKLDKLPENLGKMES